MRLVFNVTTLERHILSLNTYIKHYKMHVCKYLHACLTSKFIGGHILSCVQARVKVKHLSCTEVAIYVRASPASLLVCIFSCVLSLATEQHASFQKNITEMNVSLIRACVKFRLSCTIHT